MTEETSISKKIDNCCLRHLNTCSLFESAGIRKNYVRAV